MSFIAPSLSQGVDDCLTDLRDIHDVLPLAATGHAGNNDDALVKHPAVMGIGGIKKDSSNTGSDNYEDASALAAGLTTDASCSANDFCTPVSTPIESGGTSAATANAAGIAGLLRSHFPSWSAHQIENRLIAFGEGAHTRLNAYTSIVGNTPQVTLNGPDRPPENSEQTWWATVSGGMQPFAYEWRRDGVLVGTQSSYTDSVSTSTFELAVTVTDNIDRVSADTIFVVPCSSQCPQ